VALEVWVRRADGRLSTVGWARCPVPADTTPAPSPFGTDRSTLESIG
jgi:hypothetical protein